MSFYSLTLSAALLSGLALPAMAATPAAVHHHKVRHPVVHRIAATTPEPAAPVRTPAVTTSALPGTVPAARTTVAPAPMTSATVTPTPMTSATVKPATIPPVTVAPSASITDAGKPVTTTASPAPAKPAVKTN